MHFFYYIIFIYLFYLSIFGGWEWPGGYLLLVWTNLLNLAFKLKTWLSPSKTYIMFTLVYTIQNFTMVLEKVIFSWLHEILLLTLAEKLQNAFQTFDKTKSKKQHRNLVIKQSVSMNAAFPKYLCAFFFPICWQMAKTMGFWATAFCLLACQWQAAFCSWFSACRRS